MSSVSRRSASRARIVPALVSSADVSTRRRWTLAGGALLMCGAAACEQSRGDPDAEPAATVVVNLPPAADIEPAPRRGRTPSSSRPPNPTTSETTIAPDTSAAGGATNGPSLNVPFADYFDVDPFGAEPVRGSGCGLDTPIGDELPDGLWRGYVRSFDGLWVDAATSLEFDVACVYAARHRGRARPAGRSARRGIRRGSRRVPREQQRPGPHRPPRRVLRPGRRTVERCRPVRSAGDIAAVGGDPALPAARFVVACRERRGTLGGDLMLCPGDGARNGGTTRDRTSVAVRAWHTGPPWWGRASRSPRGSVPPWLTTTPAPPRSPASSTSSSSTRRGRRRRSATSPGPRLAS